MQNILYIRIYVCACWRSRKHTVQRTHIIFSSYELSTSAIWRQNMDHPQAVTKALWPRYDDVAGRHRYFMSRQFTNKTIMLDKCSGYIPAVWSDNISHCLQFRLVPSWQAKQPKNTIKKSAIRHRNAMHRQLCIRVAAKRLNWPANCCSCKSTVAVNAETTWSSQPVTDRWSGSITSNVTSGFTSGQCTVYCSATAVCVTLRHNIPK